MTEAAYDTIATWYDTVVRKGDVAMTMDIILRPLLALMGDVLEQRMCDLACGQGMVARELARRGARVVGVDLSMKLLEIARQVERDEPLGVTYIQDDAQTLAPLEADSFDGIVCNMALMDIPDLEALCRSVVRVLCPGGWFVCSITHPCFQTPDSDWMKAPDGVQSRTVPAYFTEGFWRSNNPNGVRGQVGAYHHTLGTYFTTLARAGLVLEQVIEPQPTTDTEAAIPGYHIVPAFMVMRWSKLLPIAEG